MSAVSGAAASIGGGRRSGRGLAKLSDEELRAKYDKISGSALGRGLIGGLGKAVLSGYEREIERRQKLRDFGKAAPAQAAAVGSAAAAVGGGDMSASLGAIESRLSELESKLGSGGSAAPTSSAPIGVPGGSEVAASNVTADNDSVSVEAPTTFAPRATEAMGDMYGKGFMRQASVGAAKIIKNKKI